MKYSIGISIIVRMVLVLKFCKRFAALAAALVGTAIRQDHGSMVWQDTAKVDQHVSMKKS